jgi:hypothetical protein
MKQTGILIICLLAFATQCWSGVPTLPNQVVGTSGLRQGLVAWWTMSENGGVYLSDAMGSNKTGVLTPDSAIPGWSIGPCGYAIKFNDRCGIFITPVLNSDGWTGVSLATSISCTNRGSGSDPWHILYETTGTANNFGVSLRSNYVSESAYTVTFGVSVYRVAWPYWEEILVTSPNLAYGTWHTVVASFGQETGYYPVLCIDGTTITYGASASANKLTGVVTSMTVGRIPGNSYSWFRGSVASMAIWSRSLSSREMRMVPTALSSLVRREADDYQSLRKAVPPFILNPRRN